MFFVSPTSSSACPMYRPHSVGINIELSQLLAFKVKDLNS